MLAGLIVCYILVAIGIRSAQQQDKLFFAVRDIKRYFVPEVQGPVEISKSLTRIDGKIAFILRPAGSRSQNLPWVWYAPTLPELPGEEERPMFDAFLKAGIAVAGIDVGESYGSPDGQHAFDAFYNELVNARGFRKHPVFLARSRGGLMAFSWTEKHPQQVAAIAGIYPVSNIASYPGVSKAASAYRMDAQKLAANLPRFNPIDNLEPMARANIPLFILHGDADETVPIEENSLLLLHRYKTLGGPVDMSVVPGQGHNLDNSFFRNSRLTRFVIDHARAAAN